MYHSKISSATCDQELDAFSDKSDLFDRAQCNNADFDLIEIDSVNFDLSEVDSNQIMQHSG